jgi:hypothetical protein
MSPEARLHFKMSAMALAYTTVELRNALYRVSAYTGVLLF